ncbi:cinnamoyl-CoA reductase 2-like isoform X2 [Papaver somniferum]|uniref:cinnamoyl-CoA reductase 2-like isoform X2 n=1 Tax=Papaver somniferum TaxID=3469 RepID=UPI000E6F9360|nr:cinnamoyl-CoA reductase 2-like isoform X2 [Papaver somniferum]
MQSEREIVGKERVCVTGAGGFIASWIVKLLLSKGYMVHGTVRDPSDEKNAHLTLLDNATENLQLFKADLQDYNSLCGAIAGCTGVFHVASPVPAGRAANREVEVIEPVMRGTRNILMACSEIKVKRLVVVSSVVSVIKNPDWPKDQPMDESCWSDEEHCRKTENWYYFAKTASEREALEYSKKNDLDVITICPSVALGPMLQSTVNSSSMILIKILKDGCERMFIIVRLVVDVRDFAEAVLLVYEKPEAEGRYLCSAPSVERHDFIDKLKNIYPKFSCLPMTPGEEKGQELNCEKLQKLGWTARPLEETLLDSVQDYLEKEILEKHF